MLYKSSRHRGLKIGDNAERKGRGYTNQDGTEGGLHKSRWHRGGRIGDNTERKGTSTNQEGTKREDRREYRE